MIRFSNFLVFLMFLLISSVCLAEDIKVIDQKGLVRAYGEFLPGAVIRLRLPSRALGVHVTLANLDKTMKDLEGEKISADQYEYVLPEAGLWRISGLNASENALTVEILRKQTP